MKELVVVQWGQSSEKTLSDHEREEAVEERRVARRVEVQFCREETTELAAGAETETFGKSL